MEVMNVGPEAHTLLNFRHRNPMLQRKVTKSKWNLMR